MSQELTYTILNSQVAVIETEIDYNGQPATIKQTRTYVEAIPTDTTGKTLSLVLPADVVSDYPEGATLTITLTVKGDTE